MALTSSSDRNRLGTPNPVTAFDPNNYHPQYMPEMTIYLVGAGGVQDWVASIPKCLAFESINDLVSAMQSIGYAYTSSFESVPYSVPAGNDFAGGPRGDGSVPWLGISPVPPSGYPPVWQASDGAFVVNGGVYGDFWNHGVHPFIGSSYHLALIDDVKMRMDAARAGTPNLGLANTLQKLQALAAKI